MRERYLLKNPGPKKTAWTKGWKEKKNDSICLSSFGGKRKMKEDTKIVKSPIKDKWTCQACCLQFAHRSGLSRHRRQKHPDMTSINVQKTFPCNICHETFRYLRNLSAHMTHAHSTHQPMFICSACDVVFRFRRNLVRHVIRSHTKQQQTNYREDPTSAEPF